MNRILILTLLTLFACVEGLAQDEPRNDVVILKDGSIIRGQLVEYIVDDHLVIINLEGERREFTADRVHQVNSKLPKLVSPKASGFINTTDLGILMSSQPWQGSQGSFSFHSVNSWQFEKLGMVGLGTGVEFLNSTMNIPLYADVKLPLAKGNVVPYFGAFGGYTFSTHTQDEPVYDLWYSYAPRSYQGGPMWGAQFGLMNYSKDRFGITFSAGYQHHSMESTYEEQFWNGLEWKTHEIQEAVKVHRVRIALGIVFR